MIDLHPLPFSFIFEYALSDGGHYTVVPPLDSFQGPGEAFVVLAEFWRPVTLIVCRSIVPPRGTLASAVGMTIRVLRPVLAVFDTRIMCRLT